MDFLQQLMMWAVGAFVVLMLGTQVLVHRRARAMRGQAAPLLPGPVGQQVAGARRSLLYFFSPSCAACRTITPRFRQLREGNADVHLVDISQDFDVASALKVMATPSTIEIVDGKVAGYHVGAPPAELMARFSAA